MRQVVRWIGSILLGLIVVFGLFLFQLTIYSSIFQDQPPGFLAIVILVVAVIGGIATAVHSGREKRKP